jgi:hypothetical protein
MFRRLLFTSSAVVLVLACSSAGDKVAGETADISQDGGPRLKASGSTPTKAECSEYAAAFCGRTFACATQLAKIVYPDEATCRTLAEQSCNALATLPRHGPTSGELGACTHAIPATSCAEFARNVGPCDLHGSLDVGDACSDDTQCSSGSCLGATPTSCGACIAPIANACNPGCERGFTCSKLDDGVNLKCTRLRNDGEACLSSDDCSSHECFQGNCAAQLAPGDACDVQGKTTPPCSMDLMAVCSSNTNRCEPSPVADTGDPCGVLANGTYVMCNGKNVCNGTTCVAAPIGGPCMSDADCPIITTCEQGTCTVAPQRTDCK